MKFIVDAQLPRKLSDYLNDIGHNSIHTSQLPRANSTTDKEINQISLAEKRIVVTKDLDFFESYFQVLEPYKLLQISTGNISSRELIRIFELNIEKMILELTHNSVVELTQESLITIL